MTGPKDCRQCKAELPDKRATYCRECAEWRRQEQNHRAGRAFRARAEENRELARQGLLWTLPASAQGSQTRTEAVTLSGAQVLEMKAAVADLAGARERFTTAVEEGYDDAVFDLGDTAAEVVRVLTALLPVTRRRPPPPDGMAQAIRVAAESAAREVLRSAGSPSESADTGFRTGAPRRPGGR